MPPQPLLLIPKPAKPGGFCNLHASPCPCLQWIWDSQPQPVLNPAGPGGICSFHLTCTSLGGLIQRVAGAGQVGAGTKPSQTPFQSPASCSTLGSLPAPSLFQGRSLVPAPSSPPAQVTPAPVSAQCSGHLLSPVSPQTNQSAMETLSRCYLPHKDRSKRFPPWQGPSRGHRVPRGWADQGRAPEDTPGWWVLAQLPVRAQRYPKCICFTAVPSLHI